MPAVLDKLVVEVGSSCQTTHTYEPDALALDHSRSGPDTSFNTAHMGVPSLNACGMLYHDRPAVAAVPASTLNHPIRSSANLGVGASGNVHAEVRPPYPQYGVESRTGEVRGDAPRERHRIDKESSSQRETIRIVIRVPPR